uniref:SET domain-containing protein n=1 Tax=Trypanosoma vivax (strain Y486) TaxID=1055687 RepID=G0TVX3_TRYVY|nr:conserved hypothetical protein [Trypanosoma vivax Y486]
MRIQQENILRNHLREEGAFFNNGLSVMSLSEMGGGYGIVATQDLSADEILVSIPHDTMITTQKARSYISAWEYEHCSTRLLEKTPLDHKGVTNALNLIEQQIADTLTPSETIVCFLLIAGILAGRFDTSTTCLPSGQISKGHILVGGNLRDDRMCSLFSHHKWIAMWLLSLPAHYDNLLELKPHIKVYKDGDSTDPVDTYEYVSSEEYLQQFLHFSRHRKKVILEQENVKRKFDHCLSVLSVLRFLLRFDDENKLSRFSSLEKFVWAYNTLMSRGFSYHTEVWVLMPWVDYFNHSSVNNATMRYDSCRRSYVFESRLAISKGEQIWLQYGSYNDIELLLWYGFTQVPLLLPNFSCSNNREERISMMHLLFGGHIGEEKKNCTDLVNVNTLQLANTAIGYCFSPLAEEDGSYPISSAGETWLELLISCYKKVADSFDFKAYGETNIAFMPAIRAADVLIKLFYINSCVSLPPHLMCENCRIDINCPSESMSRLLRFVSRITRKSQPQHSLSPVSVLRGICWSELICNCINMEKSENINILSWIFTEDNFPASTCAVGRMATRASRDASLLLYFLAVEATENEIAVYLS